jgi:hypothetical protein
MLAVPCPDSLYWGCTHITQILCVLTANGSQMNPSQKLVGVTSSDFVMEVCPSFQTQPITNEEQM